MIQSPSLLCIGLTTVDVVALPVRVEQLRRRLLRRIHQNASAYHGQEEMSDDCAY